MVTQNRKVESIGDVVMSVDGRGNYLADEKRFDAQLHKSKKKRRRSQMYISQDRTNLEVCKSVFGDDFEFDPDVVEDPDLVVAIGDVHGDVEAMGSLQRAATGDRPYSDDRKLRAGSCCGTR